MKRICRHVVWTATVIFACALSPLFAQNAVKGLYADIFAALLRNTASVGGSSMVIVDETSLQVQRLSDSEWQWFGPQTVALRAVAERAAATPADRFDSGPFPPGVTLITRDVAQRFWRAREEAIWTQ